MPLAAKCDTGLEIGLKRRVLLVRVAVLILIGALCVAGPFIVDDRVRRSSNGDASWPFGWMIFIGAVVLVAAYDAIRVARMSGRVLRLDAEGVLDRRIQSRLLPWSAARRIEIRTIRGRPAMLGFWARRMSHYRKWAPFWNYFGLVRVLQLMAWRFRFAPLSVDLQSLDIEPSAVIEAVRRHWGEPECRPVDLDDYGGDGDDDDSAD